MPAKIPPSIPCPSRDDCPYCGDRARLFPSSDHIYNGVDYGPVWQCQLCFAYVGCHAGTNKPLGRLASKPLREWKQKAHKSFDTLWHYKIKKTGCRRRIARGQAYKWLAGQLGIDTSECHIGYFTIEQCQKVVEICEPIKRRLKW